MSEGKLDIIAIDRDGTRSMLRWVNPVYGTTAEKIKEENGLKPLLDRVTILPYKPVKETASGIALPPEMMKQEGTATEFGVVIDIGRYAYNEIECPIAVGDHVVVTKYAGEWSYGSTGLMFRTVTDRMIIHRLDPQKWVHLRDNLQTFYL